MQNNWNEWKYFFAIAFCILGLVYFLIIIISRNKGPRQEN
jgi:hypothetical protein